jgi:ABC-type Fe3+/spermidine/putrescine transport system ATPase subunit
MLMLEIDGLTVERSGRRVLDGLDWRVARGEWVGLIGANGTGKSTLMGAVVGLVDTHAGQVRVGGHDVATRTSAARDLCAVAIAPERLPDGLTVRQMLELVHAARGLPANAFAALAGLDGTARPVALAGCLPRRLFARHAPEGRHRRRTVQSRPAVAARRIAQWPRSGQRLCVQAVPVRTAAARATPPSCWPHTASNWPSDC